MVLSCQHANGGGPRLCVSSVVGRSAAQSRGGREGKEGHPEGEEQTSSRARGPSPLPLITDGSYSAVVVGGIAAGHIMEAAQETRGVTRVYRGIKHH
jgi:hypothetical protein